MRKRDYFSRYNEQAREVLNALLDKYADSGLESSQVLELQPINQLGTRGQIIRNVFGGKDNYWQAIHELEPRTLSGSVNHVPDRDD